MTGKLSRWEFKTRSIALMFFIKTMHRDLYKITQTIKII